MPTIARVFFAIAGICAAACAAALQGFADGREREFAADRGAVGEEAVGFGGFLEREHLVDVDGQFLRGDWRNDGPERRRTREGRPHGA